MLQIAIVEDQKEAADELENYIKRYGDEHGLAAQIVRMPDGGDIVRAIENEKKDFDIIFMDIEMSKVDGMEAAQQIRKTDKKAVIVFVTNMAQYAIKGYEVDALDFIVKPINYFTVAAKLERAIERVSSRQEKTVEVHTLDGVRILKVSDIRYLETQNRMLYYHTRAEVLPTRSSMKQAEKDFLQGQFAKCNQCYLVNLSHVDGIKGDTVLVDGEALEMSRRNKTPFLAAFADYIGGNR